MALPKVLVTGATGKTGGAVAAELLARGYPVRAIVRVHDARSESLERRGAEVVAADAFDPDQLLAAMRGTRRAYYLPPIHPYAIQGAVAFSVAAREAGLEEVVQLGQWLSHRAHAAEPDPLDGRRALAPGTQLDDGAPAAPCARRAAARWLTPAVPVPAPDPGSPLAAVQRPSCRPAQGSAPGCVGRTD